MFLQTCKNKINLENHEYFKNILVINSSVYRAGYFAKNKKGDIIVEYSTTKQRLFYCLKKREIIYLEMNFLLKKKITGILYKNFNYEGRNESTNIFVSPKNNINKEKEYLLSLSSYKTPLEIYYIENDIMNKYVAEEIFINGIFSYQFVVFEAIIDNGNTYIFIYTHNYSNNNYKEGNYFSFKKNFIFKKKVKIILE